jgi:hypothetical protein
VASHWPFEQWGRFLPEHTTAASILDRLLHHASVVITDGESFRMCGSPEIVEGFLCRFRLGFGFPDLVVDG